VAALIIVVIDPFVQIVLQLLDSLINFLAECHMIELLQNGFVEPFADAVDQLETCRFGTYSDQCERARRATASMTVRGSMARPLIRSS
jgi:hypothetical protein